MTAATTSAIAQIDAAITMHRAWRVRLDRAIVAGAETLSSDELGRDDRCTCGQWLNGDTLHCAIRASATGRHVRLVHAAFHRAAARVLDLAIRDRAADAHALFDGDYRMRSDELVEALAAWKRELVRADAPTSSA